MTTRIVEFGTIERELTRAKRRDELYQKSDFVDGLNESLINATEHGKRILSLDVFDTLLLRDNSSELSRFLEIGKLMKDAINISTPNSKIDSIDAFVARWLGTTASYRASRPVNSCREGSIIEIHTVASRILTGGTDYVEEFVDRELNFEAGCLKPNPFWLSYIERHKSSGGRVILVTDMYLHKREVEILLGRLNVDCNLFDHIESSADTKISKSSGHIFEHIEMKLNKDRSDFVHVGDSLKGDYLQARRRGWRAMHLPIPEAEIALRRQDHLRTMNMLRERHALHIPIAMPS